VEKIMNLLIFGNSSFAQIAAEYFSKDSVFDPVCFCVDDEYLSISTANDLPVVATSELKTVINRFKVTHFYVACTYTELNRLRTQKYNMLKNEGLLPASYVSSKSFVWDNVKLGEHVFIFEDNTVQPFSEIGDNTVLWSGNHIGHHSIISKNVFVSSHCVISGHVSIGTNCFLGVNCSIANNLQIGSDSFIGPGCIVNKNVADNEFLLSSPSERKKISPKRFFKVSE
jgi:sugar O-acyltransferase (sialic acid O-acetyltransferase NeuD family)